MKKQAVNFAVEQPLGAEGITRLRVTRIIEAVG